jgi:hypothetical protein
MGRRELTRLVLATGAALLIGLVVVTLNVAQGQGGAVEDPGADTRVPAVSDGSLEGATDGTHVLEARLLAEALAEFSTQAATLLDHEPLVEGSSGLDEAAVALAQVEDSSGLAAEVCRRWSVIRPVAVDEATAEEGVHAVQALGREAGVRAAELTSILDTLSGPERRAALRAALSRPWPPAGDEGSDTPV